jgi:hypothetical protein
LKDPISAKNFAIPYLNRTKLGMMVHASHPSDGRKHKIGGLWYNKKLQCKKKKKEDYVMGLP